MTAEPRLVEAPFSPSGVAMWFVRNFMEALIWALAGAAVLVLVLTVYRFPQAALLSILAVLVAGAFARWWIGVQHSVFLPKGRGEAFHVHFRILGFSVWVARGTPADPRRNQP